MSKSVDKPQDIGTTGGQFTGNVLGPLMASRQASLLLPSVSGHPLPSSFLSFPVALSYIVILCFPLHVNRKCPVGASG